MTPLTKNLFSYPILKNFPELLGAEDKYLYLLNLISKNVLEVCSSDKPLTGIVSDGETDKFFNDLNEYLSITKELEPEVLEQIARKEFSILLETVAFETVLNQNSTILTPLFILSQKDGRTSFSFITEYIRNHQNRWVPKIEKTIFADQLSAYDMNRSSQIIASGKPLKLMGYFIPIFLGVTAIVVALLKGEINEKKVPVITPSTESANSQTVPETITAPPSPTITMQPTLSPTTTPIITATHEVTVTPPYDTYQTLDGNTIDLLHVEPKLLPYNGTNGIEYRPVTSFKTYEDLGKYIAFVTGNFGSIGNNPPLSPGDIVETSELAWDTHIKIINQGFEMYIETTEGRIKVIVGLSTEGEGTIIAYTDAKEIRRAIFLQIDPELANEELQKGIDLREGN
jgi:hypothetical protein